MPIRWKSLSTVAPVAALMIAGSLALPAGSAADEGGEPFTFKFALEDGLTWTQTMTQEASKRVGEDGPERVESSSVTTEQKVTKLPEGGYVIDSTTVSSSATRDGQPVNDPIMGLMQQAKLRLHVSDDGKLTKVDGFAELIETITKSFPPEVVAAISKVVNEDSMSARTIAEWNGRIGDFAGGTFAIGQELEVTVPFALPNGQDLEYDVKTTFPERTDCPAGSCVVVSTVYDSDPTEALKMGGDVVDEVAKTKGEEDLSKMVEESIQGARMSGTARRVIDPDTMRIFSEVNTRMMAMDISLPSGEKRRMINTEKRTFSFEYGG